MMRCEFENLIGCEITPEEYKKVETVYMAWDCKDMSKEKIAGLYKYDRELVIDTLYNYIIQYDRLVDSVFGSENDNALDMCKLNEKNNSLQQRIEELETQLHQYKTLFADIEENATVVLYETLLGVTE